MRLTYDWTEADWNEAVTLGTEAPRRRGSVPGMVYALVGIPLFGAVMDGVRSVRGTGRLTGAGMAVPLLLVLLAVVLGAGMLFARMQRRQRVRLQMPMPGGQWEAALQEGGWSFHAKAVDPASSTTVVHTVGGVMTAPELPADTRDTALNPVAELSSAREESAIEVSGIVTAAPDAATIAVRSADAVPQAMTQESTESMSVAANEDAAAPVLPKAVPSEAPEVDANGQAVAVAKTETALHPWKDLIGSRTGERVLVLLQREGFHALPLRCMTPEQAGHVHRMVLRKLRPAPTAGAMER